MPVYTVASQTGFKVVVSKLHAGDDHAAVAACERFFGADAIELTMGERLVKAFNPTRSRLAVVREPAEQAAA